VRNEKGMQYFRWFRVHIYELALNLRCKSTESLISNAEQAGLILSAEVRANYLNSPETLELREARCQFAIYPMLLRSAGELNLIKGN